MRGRWECEGLDEGTEEGKRVYRNVWEKGGREE